MEYFTRPYAELEITVGHWTFKQSVKMRRNLTHRLQSGLSIPTSFSNPPYEYENIKADVIISKAFHLLFLKHFFLFLYHILQFFICQWQTPFMHLFKFMVEGVM